MPSLVGSEMCIRDRCTEMSFIPTLLATLVSYLVEISLTFLATQVFCAPRVLAHDVVRVFHRGEPPRAVEAGADLVAALQIAALTQLTLHAVGVTDQSVTVRALEGVTKGRRCCCIMVVSRNETSNMNPPLSGSTQKILVVSDRPPLFTCIGFVATL